MVSVCLPSDALLQHLPSYLGFSYLGRGVKWIINKDLLYSTGNSTQYFIVAYMGNMVYMAYILSNSMKLSHARGATQDGQVMVERV